MTGSVESFIRSENSATIGVHSRSSQGVTPCVASLSGRMHGSVHLTIPNAINIPWELFETMIDAADPFPKDRPILLVCPVGEKTALYAAYLQTRGYRSFSLDGGILEWSNASCRLVKVS